MQAAQAPASRASPGMRRAALLLRAALGTAPAAARPVATRAAAARSADTDSITPYVKLLRDSRLLQEDLAHVEVVPVAGVTFEGRQELLQRLAIRQAVLAVREPDNPYDHKAVRLETAAGEQLGYVPRTLTDIFQGQEVSVGHVESVGPTADGAKLGARVRLFPKLPAVTLDMLPPAWEAQADLERALGAERWQQLSQAALAAAGGRCAVSGAAAHRIPLAAVPVWRFAPYDKVVSLQGLMAVAEPIAKAKRLDLLSSEAERRAALALLAGLNSWDTQELNRYLANVLARMQQLEREGWRLDLGRFKA